MTEAGNKLLCDMIELALSHNYEMNKYFCCVEKSGAYMSPDPIDLSCHPLETVVLGQKITDYVNVQIAKELQVTLQWVDGFIDGYADNGIDGRYEKLPKGHPDFVSYRDGYKDGEYFRGVINID